MHVERLTRLDLFLETLVYRLLNDVMERSMLDITRSLHLSPRQNTTHFPRESTAPGKDLREQERVLR